MQQLRLYKLHTGDEFIVVGRHAPLPKECKLLKSYKKIKWNKPKTWFVKYYKYIFLGEENDYKRNY